MERTIRVTGKGKISVKPDTIRLLIELEGSAKDYDETMHMSAKQTEIVKDCFEKLEFQRSDVKTMSFNIDTDYESYQAKDKSRKRRFVGYKYRHTMKIEFPADNVTLGKVLHSLTHCEAHPEFRIVYTVKNMEAARTLLLKQAVTDSKNKAKILSEAAEVKLGDIISIDYSWEKRDVASAPVGRFIEIMALKDDTFDDCTVDIEPEDIDVSDTVTVVWKII